MSGPLRWLPAAIARIVPLTPRTVAVDIRSAIGPHLAGQHVDLRLTAEDGYQAQRSYSIASPPGEPVIELVIERIDDGEISPWFHEVAAAGDRLELRGPIGGHFVWRPEDGGPLLLLAGGSGMAPLMAILRHRQRTGVSTPTLLVASARRWEELIFRDELLALEAQDPSLAFVAVTTRGPMHRPQDRDRRIDPTMMMEVLTAWAHAPNLTYVCGGSGFVEAATAALIEAGVSPGTIKVERFGSSGS